MDGPALRQLLDDVRAGTLTPDDAASRLRRLPYADLGFAKVDHHRVVRQGIAEAVYGPGKTAEQCASIVAELVAGPDRPSERGTRPEGSGGPVLLTRATDEQAEAALERTPGGIHTGWTVVWNAAPQRTGRVLVITAGTGDLPVAEECTTTLEAYGVRPELLVDCGVAGVHRLLDTADALAEADAVVVVAGMEGALASVVGGITPAPVIAIPTSTGYGAAFEGITALLAMLSSCAAGITVVGIDNGFGAACAVARLLP
jgi:NCAIR mutase (PurE)-related protein